MRSAGRLSAMAEGNESAEVDAIQLQDMSGARDEPTDYARRGGEYDGNSFQSATPVATRAIHVGQYADPNAAASEYGYTDEAPQEPAPETKCAV